MNRVLLVNSYSKSGIGDFGQEIKKSLIMRENLNLDYIETSPSWKTLFSIWKEILFFREKVILNLGYTSFGGSPLKNFFNFSFLGLMTFIKGKELTLILHDSPELSSAKLSGYRHFAFLKTGGRISVRMIYKMRILVFSSELYRILKQNHKLKKVTYNPLPCSRIPNEIVTYPKKKELVVHVGYFSRYKGLEIVPEVKKNLEDVDIKIFGGLHAVHSANQDGMRYYLKLVESLEKSGVIVEGYTEEEKLESILNNHRCIGILPYESTSGSSYSAIFLVERGIPIVATNLTEFCTLRNNGAGIITVDKNSTSFSREINFLIRNPRKYNELVKNNIEYCTSNLIDQLMFGLI